MNEAIELDPSFFITPESVTEAIDNARNDSGLAEIIDISVRIRARDEALRTDSSEQQAFMASYASVAAVAMSNCCSLDHSQALPNNVVNMSDYRSQQHSANDGHGHEAVTSKAHTHNESEETEEERRRRARRNRRQAA